MPDLCAYCGADQPAERDHVPPKAIFGKPRPNDLITVPCCTVCHGGTSKDDEYFRTMLAMRHDTYQHEDIQKIRPKVHRSLRRKDAQGFRDAIVASISLVPVHTRAGIQVGKVPVYNVDLERLDRVVCRIVRGLYFHETGSVLPQKCEVTAYSASGLVDADQQRQRRVRDTLRKVLGGKTKAVGAETFRYWFILGGDHPQVSTWILRFYERVHFIAISLPKEAPK